QGAGDRDALALASGHARAQLASNGVIAVGQVGDELVGQRAARGVFDLRVGRVGSPEADVLPQGDSEARDGCRLRFVRLCANRSEGCA
ncbi:MAG: hypothetical protein ACRDS9_03575, partial [Pseudonocardiaceae bacterium]